MPDIITTDPYTWPDGTIAREKYSWDRGKKHRYLIEKIWSTTRNPPMLMFVMSNPSTATVDENDPTVTRCEKRAKKHHLTDDEPLCFGGQEFGGVYITNLFSFKGIEPNNERQENPFDIENRRIIGEYAQRANTIVCAWGDVGVHARFPNQAEEITAILNPTAVNPPPFSYFGLTQARHPKHLLPIPYAEDFSEWIRPL